MARVTGTISEEPLDVPGAIAEATDETCGAIAVFVGTVRRTPAEASHSDVTALEYTAHPRLAPAKIEEIARRAAEKWHLARVIAVHRIGLCRVSEPTVVIACSAPHRAEALEACHWIIDEIKTGVPIFKREIYRDGSAWIEGKA
ncbi:MAG: molybdenum cofactor biosynthesis protein MoaE [Actinomycetota bacterium]|nr:molybdenum cofactor biosynthesis protein MoaE [Actinomycetota bacterium]